MFCSQAPFRHPIQNCSLFAKGSSKITRSEIPRLSHITKPSRIFILLGHTRQDACRIRLGLCSRRTCGTLLLSSCFSGSRQFNDNMKNAHRLIVFTCLHCHSHHGERLVSQCVGLGLRPCKVEAQRFLNMTIRHLA